VIVVGSLILTGVSMVDIMTYVCGLAIDMTKFVSCEEVSLRRCEMMNEPSGVGMSVGVVVAYSEVILLVDERCEMTVAIPPSSAYVR
jgi:hypothetical protein